MADYRDRPPVDEPKIIDLTPRRALEIAFIWICIPTAGYYAAVALGLVS